MMSLPTAGCPMFLLLIPGKLGHQSFRAFGTASAEVNDERSRRLGIWPTGCRAVECPPGRLTPVHGCTGIHYVGELICYSLWPTN